MKYLEWLNYSAMRDGSLTRIQVAFICPHDVSLSLPIKAGVRDTIRVIYRGKRPRNTSKAQCLELVKDYGITDLLPINQQGEQL